MKTILPQFLNISSARILMIYDIDMPCSATYFFYSPPVLGLLECKDRFCSDRPSRVHPHCWRLHGKRGFPHQVIAEVCFPDQFKIIILRFVYYETLVTSMKSLGVREPVISYDDLKVQRTTACYTIIMFYIFGLLQS